MLLNDYLILFEFFSHSKFKTWSYQVHISLNRAEYVRTFTRYTCNLYHPKQSISSQAGGVFGDTLTSPSADNVVIMTNAPSLGTHVAYLVITRSLVWLRIYLDRRNFKIYKRTHNIKDRSNILAQY